MIEGYRTDNDVSRSLRADLADELVKKDAITSSQWKNIFRSVPRHVFVPRIFVSPNNDGVYVPIDGTDPTQREKWLRHVYTDDICITQLDGSERAWEKALSEGSVRAERITCTSSQPSLMLNMLDELDLHDDDRVLEIGTGTGYNAALLCARLGSDRVAGVDIDPVLVAQAKNALSSLDYTPELSAGDGAGEPFKEEKFTRIIATASFSEVPAAWLNQVSDGGMILANIFRPLGGGILAALTVRDGQAQGRFSSRTAAYMPTRDIDTVTALHLYNRIAEKDENAVRPEPTSLDALSILKDPDARFFLALQSDLDELRVRYPDAPQEQWLLTQDGSWAFGFATEEGYFAKQGGKRRIWDEFTSLYHQWERLGHPKRHRFGLTVTKKTNRVWLDHPSNPIDPQ